MDYFEQFTFILTLVTIASYNVSGFAMDVVVLFCVSLQIVLANLNFCHSDPKTPKIKGSYSVHSHIISNAFIIKLTLWWE